MWIRIAFFLHQTSRFLFVFVVFVKTSQVNTYRICMRSVTDSAQRIQLIGTVLLYWNT